MTQTNTTFNPFDPTGLFKEMQATSMESWSKSMIQLVNTEGYAQASAAMLEAWLSNSAVFRKVIETSMTQALTNLNMPTRTDVTSLAQRLTNIEMRLDDLEAFLESQRPARKPPGPKTKSGPVEDHP